LSWGGAASGGLGTGGDTVEGRTKTSSGALWDELLEKPKP
jgi:hypothetical protein